MRGYGTLVREALHKGGARFVRRGKGDHDIWRAADGRHITVPVTIDPRHTANQILKDAGLPEQF